MSLAKELLKATLGEAVTEVHEQQKEQENYLTVTDKLKLRLAKKSNWALFISLGFAIADKNPVEIIENVKLFASWFF